MSSIHSTRQTVSLRHDQSFNPALSTFARITVIDGNQKDEVIFLRDQLQVFGRSNGIRLRDALASRNHMQIYSDGFDYILEDLRSCNGTYVNGCPVNHAKVLNHGDQIQVGATILLFEITGSRTKNMDSLLN